MPRLGPEESAELRHWLEQQRRLIKKQRRFGVEPELIERIGDRYQRLENHYYYEEALEVIKVGFEGVKYVKRPAARQKLGYRVWRSKAVTSNWLGRYGDSIEAYEKAIELGEKGAYAGEKPEFDPNNRRELGLMYWRVGDLSKALRNLSIAEEKLEKAKSILREPDYLDQLTRLRTPHRAPLKLLAYTRGSAKQTQNATCNPRSLTQPWVMPTGRRRSNAKPLLKGLSKRSPVL